MEVQSIKNSFIPKLAEFFDVEISDLFSSEASINIKQPFKKNTVDTAILIITDKEIINRVLDAIKLQENK